MYDSSFHFIFHYPNMTLLPAWKDLDWDELGGYINWQPPPSHSQVLFYELLGLT